MEYYSQILKFIRNLYSEPTGFVPLHVPAFAGNEMKYLKTCIDTAFVSSVGKFVDQFEEKIQEYTGAKKAVACVNGTSALHIALKLVGVEPGTEVITQPLTFIATANAISYCGAKPVFLDVDADTMGLSPVSLNEWLSTNVKLEPKTNQPVNRATNQRIAACVPVHSFGHPCRIDEIVDVCNKYNLPVIEDAAESLGSYYKNQHTGTFGKIGVLSFNGNKIITTGGGGMLLFKDEKLAKQAKHLTTQAKVPHPWEFMHDEVGYNYRMPNINAALGIAQLEQLPLFLESKRNIAKEYRAFFEQLNKTPGSNNNIPESGRAKASVLWCDEPSHASSNFWLNCVLLPDIIERDAFLEFSNKHGVMTRPAWRLMTDLEMFNDCEKGCLSNAENLAERLVNVPSSALTQFQERN